MNQEPESRFAPGLEKEAWALFQSRPYFYWAQSFHQFGLQKQNKEAEREPSAKKKKKFLGLINTINNNKNKKQNKKISEMVKSW